ncbi:arylamine N-acetyltransferase [Lysobacter sp. BMK333-48F3]|uniref:arylamine N-acetyltransferase family protein n=1 Tax=Lysobacter sp. BMK333-48F3 TaxID=2867962 RepID=UPI001C8C9F44|nr:arylamine N-acetyltransferase [Lysobacter sp. BMK333-48F3]MBX9401524.1 arylamine N-acetyltransferase [Lysobacter sp. BMK333-48F3]
MSPQPESTLPQEDLQLYLQRLGYERAPAPTLDSLRELQRRHSHAFVFETINSLLQAPIPIDLPSLRRKLLHDGRGGYCYELNGLFLTLLQQLGFQARGLTGRVLMGGPEDAVTARTHLVALVEIDRERWIADVGFGGMVPTGPLRLDETGEQTTPHEPYRLERRDAGQYLLRAKVGEEWRAMYVFDLAPQEQIDYVVGNWYVSSHPQSPFRGQLFVARTGPGWRKTLNNDSYAVHRLGQPSERRELAGADEVIEVLREQFGLRLPDEAALREAIGRQRAA